MLVLPWRKADKFSLNLINLKGRGQVATIIHTGDLHLQENAEYRWEALGELVKTARDRKADIMVICGDLIEDGSDSKHIWQKFKNYIKGENFYVLVAPGNQDRYLKDEASTGETSPVIVSSLEEPVEVENIRFWGIPPGFKNDMELGRLLRTWARRLDYEKTDILLYHGEIMDKTYERSQLGGEFKERYLPFKLEWVQEFPVDYILGGHLHPSYESFKLQNGSYFVYPGAPVSITRRDTGRRKANLVYTGQEPQEITLNTFHYQQLDLFLNPENAWHTLESLKEFVSSLPPSAYLFLEVTGFVDFNFMGIDKSTMEEEIRKLAFSYCNGELRFEFQDVSDLIDSDLYCKYIDYLKSANLSLEEKEQLKTVLLQAMVGLFHEN